MTEFPAIGGYFGIDIPAKSHILPGALRLNSARNCLKILLCAVDCDIVYLPFYCCSAIRQAVEEAGKNVALYQIDSKLEIANPEKFNGDEVIVYVNYCGVKDEYSKHISGVFSRLVLDNSQALYSQAKGSLATVFSPRKFMGLPDGGLLMTDVAVTVPRETQSSLPLVTHLLKRIDESPENGYADFVAAEETIASMATKSMSRLSEMLLDAADHSAIADKRKANFGIAEAALGQWNSLQREMKLSSAPLCYPLLLPEVGRQVRTQLVKARIFIPTYWPEVITARDVPNWDRSLALDLLAIPIDQRYCEGEVADYCSRIARVVFNN